MAKIWVTGLRYLLAHPSIIGGDIGRRGLGEKGFTLQCSVGGDMRREWLAAEFALVDEDSYGFVSEDVAVATICKLCPGIKKIKVRRFFKRNTNRACMYTHFYVCSCRHKIIVP